MQDFRHVVRLLEAKLLQDCCRIIEESDVWSFSLLKSLYLLLHSLQLSFVALNLGLLRLHFIFQ